MTLSILLVKYLFVLVLPLLGVILLLSVTLLVGVVFLLCIILSLLAPRVDVALEVSLLVGVTP